ncbi:MAG: hypothetical protein J6Y92_06085 [Lentisphaeria bacterium]|nr:hypothetical protein [Lentisphaeria bacterium]
MLRRRHQFRKAFSGLDEQAPADSQTAFGHLFTQEIRRVRFVQQNIVMGYERIAERIHTDGREDPFVVPFVAEQQSVHKPNAGYDEIFRDAADADQILSDLHENVNIIVEILIRMKRPGKQILSRYRPGRKRFFVQDFTQSERGKPRAQCGSPHGLFPSGKGLNPFRQFVEMIDDSHSRSTFLIRFEFVSPPAARSDRGITRCSAGMDPAVFSAMIHDTPPSGMHPPMIEHIIPRI